MKLKLLKERNSFNKSMDTQKLKNVGLKSIIKDKASRERDSVIKIKENVENI